MEIRTGTEAGSLVRHPHKGSLFGVRTKNGELLAADYVVLCTGAETNLLSKTAGITLPVWPARAHSVIFHVPHSLRSLAPQRAVLDPSAGVLASRVANTVRFTSVLQLSNEKVAGREWLVTSLLISARKMFPALSPILLDRGQLEIRTGVFALSPDGVPIISGTRLANLYVNTGHGMNSLGTALGAGEVLCDLLEGKENPDTSMARFS